MGRIKISGAQNLSGVPRFLPAHWGLAVLKLRLVRFHNCAWLCRANDPGANPAPPKPSPWGEGAPVHTLGRMRGQVSPSSVGRGLPDAPSRKRTGGPVCRPYGNEGMSQNIASPDAQLEPRPGASLVSFWASRKKLAARRRRNPLGLLFLCLMCYISKTIRRNPS